MLHCPGFHGLRDAHRALYDFLVIFCFYFHRLLRFERHVFCLLVATACFDTHWTLLHCFPLGCVAELFACPCLDCIFPNICLLILLFSPCLDCIFPNICLLILLFSLCLHCSCQICVCCYCGSVSVCTVPAKYSSADTLVQPLCALFLPNIRLLILLFSLCLHCSCRIFVC